MERVKVLFLERFWFQFYSCVSLLLWSDISSMSGEWLAISKQSVINLFFYSTLMLRRFIRLVIATSLNEFPNSLRSIKQTLFICWLSHWMNYRSKPNSFKYIKIFFFEIYFSNDLWIKLRSSVNFFKINSVVNSVFLVEVSHLMTEL